MTDWKKVYRESRIAIKAQATSGLFVAAVYLVIAILGLVFVAGGRPLEVPLGVLFVPIGLIGGVYLGWQALREYFGDPLILTARVVRKQDAISYSRNGTLHRYYLHIEVSKAVHLAADGDPQGAIFPRQGFVPAQEKLFRALKDNDNVVLVCTANGFALTTLDDLGYSS